MNQQTDIRKIIEIWMKACFEKLMVSPDTEDEPEGRKRDDSMAQDGSTSPKFRPEMRHKR